MIIGLLVDWGGLFARVACAGRFSSTVIYIFSGESSLAMEFLKAEIVLTDLMITRQCSCIKVMLVGSRDVDLEEKLT